MLLLPPYPLHQATCMTTCEPSAVTWLCVSVLVCMGVSHSTSWLCAAHIKTSKSTYFCNVWMY